MRFTARWLDYLVFIVRIDRGHNLVDTTLTFGNLAKHVAQLTTSVEPEASVCQPLGHVLGGDIDMRQLMLSIGVIIKRDLRQQIEAALHDGHVRSRGVDSFEEHTALLSSLFEIDVGEVHICRNGDLISCKEMVDGVIRVGSVGTGNFSSRGRLDRGLNALSITGS
ncbi:TIM barrel metal-dependent hydrolase [Apiospora arundinis]